jgi:leucyl aminopeptidase
MQQGEEKMGEAPMVRLAGRRPGKAEVFVLACFERERPEATGLPRRIAAAALKAVDRKGWTGAVGQVAETRSSESGTPFVSVHGLGAKKAFGKQRLQVWLEKAVARLTSARFGNAIFKIPDHSAALGVEAAILVLRTLSLADYRFERFRTIEKGRKRRVLRLRVIPPIGEEANYRRGARIADAIARGVTLTRSLANAPPNEATPEWMEERSRELAEAFGMQIEVLGPDRMRELGMGGILAVGGGSARAPRLVKLSWGEGEESVALVGKGVTFDTGGISLKPASTMDEMKFDKAGACTVLGVARAAAQLDAPFHFSVYLPLAENMPDGAAYRPGDIVRCYGGKTVEILNTDAEGRMLLADALALAAEEQPDWLIDFATLTGACVVALGYYGAGLFTPNDELAGEFQTAANMAQERIWRLPLWSEFGKEMKGQHADLRNSGGSWGGASTAAAFLANFVGRPESWAHLDIAGPSYIGRGRKGRFGATGYGVPLTLLWLLRRSGGL